MLFCSPEFALFFSLLFVAYWALPARRARVGLLAVAGPFFLYHTYLCLLAQSAGDWGHWLYTVRTTLTAAGPWYERFNQVAQVLTQPPLAVLPGQSSYFWLVYWVAGIVGAASVLAFRLGHDRGRVWLLVLASFYFYASWNKWLAALICLSTAMDYLIARGLDGFSSPRLRKLLLAGSLFANLGLLFYFKYENFFLRSLEETLRL